MKKRLLALFLTLILAVGLFPAAAAIDINDHEVFLKQSVRGTCTVTSAAMMLRRRAILDGDADWASTTEASVKRVSWSGGLAWNFTYNGLSVSVMRKASGWGGNSLDDKKAFLIDLLANHPEGVVGYASGQPHAVLLTDYDAATGTFYCCDPASSYMRGRVPLTGGSIKGGSQDAILERIGQLWYVSGGQSKGAGTMPVPAAPSWDVNATATIASRDIDVNGVKIAFQTYVVLDDAGNETCFVDVQSLAHVLSGSMGQFDVAIGPQVLLFPGVAYPYDSIGAWEDFPAEVPATVADASTLVDGALQDLDAIRVTDNNDLDHFYYKLRDLADVLGFQVGWDAQRGTYVETVA